MAGSHNTIKQLKGEIQSDFNKFMDRFLQNLRATTPIRTGFARSSWRKYPVNVVGNPTKQLVAKNTADYSDKLDRGASTQAPNGIVDVAFKQTRK